MSSVGKLAAAALGFRETHTSEQILDALEGCFGFLQPTHFLVTGVPMPGRPLEPLVLRRRWGGRWPEEAINADDALFRDGIALRGPIAVSDSTEDSLAGSIACRSMIADGVVNMIWVPVNAFQPYQAMVVVGHKDGSELDPLLLAAFECVCTEAFRQLLALKVISTSRPGDLSGRERRVVGMSAGGKTAADIADALAISQRTVHAHLQNASDKLRARNKTQTVVEALRYGQITL